MANISELAERLLRRFKGVPNYEITDAADSVADAMQVIGYDPSDSVPTDKETALLLLAQSESAFQIAFSVAHYFKFTDGEESVDKSMLSENYRKLAADLRRQYDAESAKSNGSGAYTAMRIDRPNTTPRTGESGRNVWRRY
ncbi:hypothetical protein I2483_13635 [Sporosarcina sp. E16_3]|uniref:hypothetical protein n=1 Tax=Sporosarcina sp. E16_3 TaxID=2789293 RepID=UPI001A90E851|nr:hypothetical protein [Sporosarcina sp. E16_3]MBO0602704.1 hypothetical protein [Sporosarcina sp. E16_3]